MRFESQFINVPLTLSFEGEIEASQIFLWVAYVLQNHLAKRDTADVSNKHEISSMFYHNDLAVRKYGMC
jgi:hypothetical protein